MTWTKQLPSESGFYWMRANEYVRTVFLARKEFSVPIIYDVGVAGAQEFESSGEFWPVRIEPPKETP